jgi:hypothetical protein
MILRHSQKRAGAAMVEMAVASIPFTLFVFALFDYCRYEMHRHQVTAAAREAARLAVVGRRSLDTAAVQARAARMLVHPQPHKARVEVYRSTPVGESLGDWQDAVPGEYIAVRVETLFTPLFSTLGFLPKQFPVRVTMSMRNEVP